MHFIVRMMKYEYVDSHGFYCALLGEQVCGEPVFKVRIEPFISSRYLPEGREWTLPPETHDLEFRILYGTLEYTPLLLYGLWNQSDQNKITIV